MTNLLILSCSDPLLWYRNQIGCMTPIVRNLPAEGCWLAREPDGCANIVRHSDAVVVPDGFATATDPLLIQPGDLLLLDHIWVPSRIEQWGTQIGERSVIRQAPNTHI